MFNVSDGEMKDIVGRVTTIDLEWDHVHSTRCRVC